MEIYIFMLLMFTRSLSNGLSLESNRTVLDTTQFSTSTINFSRLKTDASLHPTPSSILSTSQDSVPKTSSTIHIKNSQKLTAFKTESLPNSHATKTEKEKSTFLAIRLSTEPIPMTITGFIPASIKATSSLKTVYSPSKSLQTNITKPLSSLEYSATTIQSSTSSSRSVIIRRLSGFSAIQITTTVSNQFLLSSVGINTMSSRSSVLHDNQTESNRILVLASVSQRQPSTTFGQFHPTQSLNYSQSILSNFYSTIPLETRIKMSQTGGHDMKSSILSSNVQSSDYSPSRFPSVMQSNGNSMSSSCSKPLDLETSYSSIELSSTLITSGVVTSIMSLPLSSQNIFDVSIFSEIQETSIPSSSKPNLSPKRDKNLSHMANESSLLLTISSASQENITTILNSTMVNKTEEAFLLPTIYIEPTAISTESAKPTSIFFPPKLFTPPPRKTVISPIPTRSRTTVIPPSSSDKPQNYSTISNDLPNNPTATHIMHTTETKYYPTHTMHQKYNVTVELTFHGKCEPLRTSHTYRHFVDNVQSLISKKLRLKHNNVIVHNLTCAPVHIHVTFLNIMITNLTGRLQYIIGKNKMNVTVYGDRQQLHYVGTTVKIVPFPTGITEILAQSQDENTEVVVIIIASTIIILLVFIGFVVFGRECYRRKRSQTFDLMNTPHAHLKMEDFTLTRIPRTAGAAWYSDDGGVTIQRFSETNRNNIVKPSNCIRKQPPAISCISDMLREKDTNGRAHLQQQFSYKILPSNRKDSQDTTVSTASDGNFRHSTDSLVAMQCSNMHGALNPIYLGDECPRLLPPSQVDQGSDLLNGQQENRTLKRK